VRADPPVRRRPEEIAAVKRIVAAHCGAAAALRVFGSRADLGARGGDPDLHVRRPGPNPGWPVEARCVGAIAQALAGWHTDRLVLGADGTPRRVDAVALARGVLP
jgi:hypothetical protein